MLESIIYLFIANNICFDFKSMLSVMMEEANELFVNAKGKRISRLQIKTNMKNNNRELKVIENRTMNIEVRNCKNICFLIFQ